MTTDRPSDRTGERSFDSAVSRPPAESGDLPDEAFSPDAADGGTQPGVPSGARQAADRSEVAAPIESSYVRTRSARRRWRRRLAAGLVAAFTLGWLAFGVTFYRDSFERKQEKHVKAALASGEFAGVRVVADGRRIVLEGSVASAADAQTAAELAKRVRFVTGVDTSKLQIGGSAGRVLPLQAIYSEGKVSFEGSRPSEAALQALVKAAAAGLGDASVTTQFAEPTGSGGDVEAYAALGAAFARFPAIGVRSVTVDVTETDARVTGRVTDDAGRSELIQTLSSATARTVIDDLQIETGSAAATSTLAAPDGTTDDAGAATSVAQTSGAETTATGTSTVAAGPTVTLEASAKATLQSEVTATLKANRIEFATDSAALSARAKAIIADIAARLGPTGASFEVGGHTDSRGRADRNLALSQRRADAVRDEFVNQGIAASRVTAKGYGSQQTVAPDNDSRGNPLNRRIEITLQ